MNEKNNVTVYIIIGIAVVVVIIAMIGIASVLIGNNNDPVSTETIDIPGVAGETQESDMPIAGVYKDSILKSVDSGLNFDTYFWIGTETELGAIDVLSITFHPEVQNNIVVSTYDDGLFINEGKNDQWQPIAFPPQKIYSFILDKNDPDNRAFASGVVGGNGRIFRTTDKGTNWRAVYAEPGNNTYVSALTQDPLDNNIIVAGTSAGTLIRSTDGGDTWKNIGQKISGNISHFTHDSKEASFVYLLLRGGKIYHSYDAGLTWLNWEEEKTKEITALSDRATELSRAGNKDGANALKDQVTALKDRNKTEKTPSGIIFIVADPNTSGVLYASLNKGLYRSTDYGKYWKQINIIESAERFPIPSVAINPDNSDEISFVAGNSFYRSINYGATWAVTPLDKTRNASFVAYDPFDTNVIYLGLSAKK
jgi:photosystem II stability/assembly factor-like uncharacterized protein